MTEYIQSIALLLVLLNPFLIIIYLIDIATKLKLNQFSNVVVRAGIITFVVFCFFAILGDAVFSDIVQADFASFQIFGGVIFLMIGLKFVFNGPHAIEMLRGESEQLAGAIAIPIMIGPGTISASVVIGRNHEPLTACALVLLAMVICTGIMIILKSIHDIVRPRNERLVQRYIEITGRISALYIGTVAIDMIMQGLRSWAAKF